MTTRFNGKWLLLGIDLFIIAISFFMAYLLRFNFSLNFDTSKLAFQLPVVVVTALLAFLITGSYEGISGYTPLRNMGTVFKAICLSALLVFVLIMINQMWAISAGFNIPLSILVLFSLFSFAGLTAVRLGIMRFPKKTLTKGA